MAEIKLTKQELRVQQQRLQELSQYLPTLQLKKAILQTQVQEAHQAIQQEQSSFNDNYSQICSYGALLSGSVGGHLDEYVRVVAVQRGYENNAGVEIPYLEKVEFAPLTYSLMNTPVWLDAVVVALRQLVVGKAALHIAKERVEILSAELREVTIRVNLFEKILIPRAEAAIKQIRIFIGDQQLSAIGRAKVAKQKIAQRRHLQEN
jgi:V/A-type H+-transporting ATPase subunit D